MMAEVLNSIRTLAHEDGARCTHEDFDVEPGRPRLGVSQIQPDHFIEFEAASAVNLPQPSDSWLDFQYPATVPRLVSHYFVGNCRARADQRHVPFEHIQKLRQFIEAGSPQQPPRSRHPLIISKLVYSLNIPVRRFTLRLAGYQFRHIFSVNARIIVDVHRSEF